MWSGTDVAGGDRVAVKLLDQTAPDLEGRLLHGLRHPHVLSVLRVCHDPRAVVTELAEGGSLAAQVWARGALPAAEVVTVLAPIAATLAHLHERAVVHGDVTADNILFVDQGRPVLADLGGAHLAGAGVAVATPGFAAPEVRAGAPPTAASDVHGLAAVAWLALTGAAPPDAEDRLPLRLLAPDCPDALVDVVTAGLDPDPAARPDPVTVAGVARAACRGVPVRLVPAASGLDATDAVTYRVAEVASDGPLRARGGWLRGGFLRVARRSGPLLGRWLRGRWRRVPGRRGSWTGRSRSVLVATGGALVAVVVVVAAAVGVMTTGWQQADRSAGPGPLPTASTLAAAAGVAAPVDAEPPIEQPAASDASADLTEAITELVGRRQTMLRTGDESRLVEVHHPSGATMATDRELLVGGPLPVTYEVLSVERVQRAAGGQDADAASGGSDGSVVARVRLRTSVEAVRSAPRHDVVEDVLLGLEKRGGELLLRSVTTA